MPVVHDYKSSVVLCLYHNNVSFSIHFPRDADGCGGGGWCSGGVGGDGVGIHGKCG